MHEELIKRVMDKLLDGNNSMLEILRKQYKSATVHAVESSPVGFFVDFDVTTDIIDEKKYKTTFHLGDIYGNVGNMKAAVGFVLFVQDGKITTLEGYNLVADKWPDDSKIELQYESGEQRNIECLRRSWNRENEDKEAETKGKGNRKLFNKCENQLRRLCLHKK